MCRRRRRADPVSALRVATVDSAACSLAVDVGNTQTVLGLFDDDRLTADWRLATVLHAHG